jgi:hypothetical protein
MHEREFVEKLSSEGSRSVSRRSVSSLNFLKLLPVERTLSPQEAVAKQENNTRGLAKPSAGTECLDR